MSSQNLTGVQNLQAYVHEFAPDLIHKIFYGFKTGSLITSHEGVKGKKTLTELTLSALSQRYGDTFSPIANAINYVPRTLEVYDAKIDLKVVPKKLETSYLGKLRQKGQNPMDWPFEAYVLDQIISKIGAEKEFAIWQAVKTATPASGDLLAVMFDGFHKIIADEILASNLNPTATGALTSTNAVGAVEDVLENMGSQYQALELDVWMSTKGVNRYLQDHRTRYGNTTYSENAKAFKGDIGNLNIRMMPGVKENAILITPAENLHYGYDGIMDSSIINMEQEDRSIKLWIDYKIGGQIGIVDNDIIGVNDGH